MSKPRFIMNWSWGKVVFFAGAPVIVSANAYAVGQVVGQWKEPSQPRYETPSEREGRKARPAFRKPSELAAMKRKTRVMASTKPAAVKNTAKVTTQVLRSKQRRRDPFFQQARPSIYFLPAGASLDFSNGLPLPMTTPQRRVPKPKTASNKESTATFVSRGFFAVVQGSQRDYSGAELIAAMPLTDDVQAAALFHHEKRERSANFGALSMTARIDALSQFRATVGAGGGSDYLPKTLLAGELRGAFSAAGSGAEPGGQGLRYGLGAAASWWHADRTQVSVSSSFVFNLSKLVSLDQRFAAELITAKAMPARLSPRTTTTLSQGRPQRWLLYERISLGSSPPYRPGVAFDATPSQTTADFAFVFQHWIPKLYDYGYIVTGTLGTQLAGYQRVGIDIALFVQL